HRQVKPGLSILLTDYSKLFTRDLLLPAGNLREPRRNAIRADVIVVTKCPINISSSEKKEIEAEVKLHEHQRIFFSSLKYGGGYDLFSPELKTDLTKIDAALLVTGIASPESLLQFVQIEIRNVKHLKFRDHYAFTAADVKRISDEFQ